MVRETKLFPTDLTLVFLDVRVGLFVVIQYHGRSEHLSTFTALKRLFPSVDIRVQNQTLFIAEGFVAVWMLTLVRFLSRMPHRMLL